MSGLFKRPQKQPLNGKADNGHEKASQLRGINSKRSSKNSEQDPPPPYEQLNIQGQTRAKPECSSPNYDPRSAVMAQPSGEVYPRVTLAGVVAFTGDGKVTADYNFDSRVYIDGNIRVLGNINTTSVMTICGNARIGGTMQAHSIFIYGNVIVDSQLWAKDRIHVSSAKVNGDIVCDGEIVVQEQSLVSGRVAAGKDLFVVGDTCLTGEICVKGDAVIYGFARILGPLMRGGETRVHGINA